LKQIYLRKAKLKIKRRRKKKRKAKGYPPDRIKKKKLKKDHYTGGQDLHFLLESTQWRC
jgi:hypothetical protein